MDLRPRWCVILSQFKNGKIRQNTRKKTNSSKTAESSLQNRKKTYKRSTPKRRRPRKTVPSRVNKNIVEHSTHTKTATQCDANKNKTGEHSVDISKQQNSGKDISRCVIGGTSEDNILIAPKAILKRRKSDSVIEIRQNSTKQHNNSCDNQMTSKRQRIKNDYFVKADNNNAENIIVSPRKRKRDSEFETQSTTISNQSFEISPKKRRQETSVCDNTNISITNTKITTAPKFIKIQNQLSCNQSTTSKKKLTEKETLNGDKTNVTINDNSEILQNERMETCSEMQKNRSPFSKNLEMDDEDIYVVYDNFSTEDRNVNVQSHDINILNRNHERSTTYQSEINNASRKNSHDKIENSRKLLNSMPVYNTNKRYFKTFTAAYDNSLGKDTVFKIENLYRVRHISELDLSSTFRYGNQFSSHLTNKIIRLPIDTSEYRFNTVCDLNESFLFNLIAAEDNDKLKFDNLQNIECVIYYSCKNNEKLKSVNRTKTNFAGRIILTSDTKHLIKYPADLKKYLLNKSKRDFPHLRRRSIDNDVGDTNWPSNEADVYFVLRGMIQGISKKYEKQKHFYKCKCCSTPFRTYNELEPICRGCNIYCTLDLHVKHFDSKDFSKINTDSNEKNVTSGKYSTKSLITVEDELIHETPVNLESSENSSVTNPINNTCLHLISGSPVTDRQESQQKLLVENTDEGKDANTGAELIMLDTSEGCGEHGTCMVTEEIPQIFETLTEIEKIDMSEVIEGIIQALDAEIENPDITVENDAMPEHLEGEITDEKDGCEELDDAILLKSTKTVQFEDTVLPSLDAEPQGQDNDDSNIQIILLDDINSGEISSTVEITVADDEQNLSKNNSVPSCTSQSIGTTSISEPDISEIQIIERTSIRHTFVIQYCQSSTDTSNLPLPTSDVSKDSSQNSVVPTCFSNPNSPEIEIIDAIIKPLKSSSNTDNRKLHSPTIDEPQKNLSKKSPIPTSNSRPDSPEIQIIDAIIKPIKSSSNTDNPKLHSTTIDEPEENLSKKSPISTNISQTESPEIQIIEDTPICLSSSDTSNPKLPSDTIDGTAKNLSENSSKPACISQSDSSEIRIIECFSISQSMDMPNLFSTTTDVSADLSENSSLPTDMPNLLATTTDVSADLSENSSLPTDIPNLLATTTDVSADLSENSSLPTDMPNLLATTTVLSDDLSENSSLPTNISRCFDLKIQLIEYNSVCQSSDAQDPKLLHESVLKIPVEMDSIEMSSNIDDNFVNNEGHLSENSLEPVCNSQSDYSEIQILEYKSLWQSDPKLLSNTTEESGEKFSENSQMTTSISQSVPPEIKILNYNSICEAPRDSKLPTTDESVLKTPVIIYSGEMPSNVADNFVNNEENLSENSPERICNSQNVVPKIPILEYDSLSQSDPKIFSNTTEESEENLSENSQMPTRISRPVSPKVQILECNSICEYSSETSKLPSTTSDESKENLSENSLEPNHISQSIFPKIQILESNSISQSSSDIHNPKSPNSTATTGDSNLNIPVIPSVKSLTDTLNSTNELLGNSAISDKIIFSRTLPTSSVTDTSINSIEEATLEEEVQRKAAENANSALERDFCDISNTKDHSESNFISDRDNYMNACNTENSLQVGMGIESPEHDAKKDEDFTRISPILNLNDSLISSKEEVPLGEKVQIKNTDSNCTHERNVCEFSDTKDHSESNFTSDENSYMNDSQSENSSQVSMDAEESTERDILKSNSISPEFLNSQNSNNLSLKTEKKGDDYAQTLLPANVNESSISCTEEITSEEVVQRKTAKNSNCAVERDFSGTKDHSESDFISGRDSYLNDCNSEKVSIDIEETTTLIPDSNSLSDEFLNFRKAKKDDDDYTPTLPTASVNDSSISSAKDLSVVEEVQRQTAENSIFSLETGSCDVSDTKDHSESDFISGRDSYLNDCNSEKVSIDIEESTTLIPDSNSLSDEFLNFRKAKKDDDDYTRTLPTASVNDSSISSAKDLSVVEEVQRQTAENSNFSLETGSCDVSDTKDHSESNFISDRDSYLNDYNSENSLQVSIDTEESTKIIPEVNSMSHELLNSPNSNELPLKKTQKYSDVSDCSVSSTEELSLEEKMQRKNSENSNYTPERYFCDFNDVKNHNESNLKQNTDKYKVSSSNFVYVDEDFPKVFLKYVRVFEDLLPQEIISVKRSNADGSENAYLTLEMLGIASTIASLDILNDYSKVSQFIDFVSKCIYYLENHENRDESQILNIKCFLKKLYVINDFIEKYGTYDKLAEDLLKNGGKISVLDSNRDVTKEGNLVGYSNIDPKLRKKKSLLETKDDPSSKGTTSNICDTFLELLRNPALLANVSHQTSSKHKNRYVKFCVVINCKACNIYSDRDGDKLEAIAKASEDYDESHAQMSSESKHSNSHESGTRLHNKGLRLEKCIKKIKNMNEPISSDVSPGSSKKQLISGFQGMSPTNKSNTLSSTSESDFHAALTSPSKTITYDSISPVHGDHFSTNSKTVITFSESLDGADNSKLNNTSCLFDYSRVVEALTNEKNSEISQNRLSPKSLMNQVLKEKRPYRKRSDNTIKGKRKYRKRNVKPTEEQFPVSTSSISSLGQSIDTPAVGFKAKENALANPPVPLCNQNANLFVSQEQQPASENHSIPLCNQNPSQGQQYPLANLSVPLGNHGAICMDERQSLYASQASGNMHYDNETNPHFDYRMFSYTSPSQFPLHIPLTQSPPIQGVPHITGASSTSDALVRKNVRQTDSSSLSRCSAHTSVTARTDICFETQYTPSLRHLENFVSESRSSNTSRGEFSNYEKNIQNTRTFTGSRAVPYPPQYMPRYPETFSQRPPLHSSRTLSSTSQPSSQSMYPGHHTYPYQCYTSMPHCSSTMTQCTPIVPPSSYPQSSYSSSQSTPIIPSPSYTHSSYSSFQPLPSLQRIPYPSPRMQRSSSDPRTLPYLHQMNLPYTHNTYK